MKNISFLSENFKFLEVKFSIYLNGRVFVKAQSDLDLCCPRMPRRHIFPWCDPYDVI